MTPLAMARYGFAISIGLSMALAFAIGAPFARSLLIVAAVHAVPLAVIEWICRREQREPVRLPRASVFRTSTPTRSSSSAPERC